MPSERDRLHFVGSIPLSSSEDVFRQLSTQVGQFLRRMPDGETGERTLWIKFQQKMLFEHPAMEPEPDTPAAAGQASRWHRASSHSIAPAQAGRRSGYG